MFQRLCFYWILLFCFSPTYRIDLFLTEILMVASENQIVDPFTFMLTSLIEEDVFAKLIVPRQINCIYKSLFKS